MKKAGFITHPEYVSRNYGKHQQVWDGKVYNSHELPLEPSDGLLQVMTTFQKKSDAKRITLRATALGIFDLFLNGKRVGQKTAEGVVYDELKPGWTDYRHRVFEMEYDITDWCEEDNRLVAEVSDGWWSGRISCGYHDFKPCAFAGEIEIEYLDGSMEWIASDESWQVSVGGPVRLADIWDGEYYDATFPRVCCEPSAYSWRSAVAFEDFEGQIVPLVGPAVRVKKHLTRVPMSAVVHCGTEENGSEFGKIHIVSKSIGVNCEKLQLSAGQSVILDMGQEMVGRPVLHFSAERGTRLEVFFAEMLNDSGESSRGNDGPKGSMYLNNYRSALSRLVYIASGNDEESYRPTHTFFGFRYLEICADRDIELHSVQGEVIGSDIIETGDFVCDHPEVNRLYSNIVWGMRGNYLSVPTDCPQRDERLGWTGDTQIFCGAASYMADICGFMHKWLGDARDSQKGYDGVYSDIIPRVFKDPGWKGGNAAWADAGLIVPYRLWLMYGDTEILNEHYESMEDYMAYLERFGLDGPGTTYGDWLNYDTTDPRYIAICYYAYDAELMEKFSRILGKTARAEYYHALHERIVAYWREKYIQNNELIIHTQAAYLWALGFHLVPEELREETVALLRRAIEENDYTLTTGFVGTGIINPTLASVGLEDLCYDLLLQTKDPSWLYSVRQGSTTMWERWNSYTYEKGFGNVVMNSFNHYAFGAVAEWLYSGMCGILPDEAAPSFSRFILRPTPDMRKYLPAGQKKIGSAKAGFDSRYGRIESGWQLMNDKYLYTFRVPTGTKARVELICEKDILSVNGLLFTADDLGASREGKRLCFELGEGEYSIQT